MKALKFYLVEEDGGNFSELEQQICSYLCADRYIENMAMCQLKNKKIMLAVCYCSKHSRTYY